MDRSATARPLEYGFLAALLMLMGIGGMAGGATLFLAPSGALMQMPLSYIEGTVFHSFLVPGIVLFLFVGLFPILTGIGLLRLPAWRWANALNICKSYHWSWTAAWAAGLIMLIWIAVETALVGYVSFLQPVVAGWGLVIIGFTFSPRVRRYSLSFGRG